MNCTKTLELIKESQVLHTQALAQIQKFCDTFSDMRPKNDLNIFTELRKINTEYERLKSQINGNLKTIESLLQFFTYEKYFTDLHPFMIEMYEKKWFYNSDQLETVKSVTSNPDNIHIDEEIPFDALEEINTDEAKIEENKSKIGELHLTSEQIDFENAKVFIPEIPDYIKEQGVSGVMKYIHKKYKDTHILPDLKYYKYLVNLSHQFQLATDAVKMVALFNLVPRQLQDTQKRCYFPSSVFVDEAGCWMSPFLRWQGIDFARGASKLDNKWDVKDRVILLER